MRDDKQNVLYVGKAKNLKKRVFSYFQHTNTSTKTQALMSHVKSIDTIMTATEIDALLLENDFIKKYRPKYNILFRDDKSYPYLFLSNDEFPYLIYCRSSKSEKGRYFGPYPNSSYAKEMLHLLQKVFLIRNCKNSFFKSRTRPCLQYQMHRCAAPCVQLISKEDYQKSIFQIIQCLSGQNTALIKNLNQEMTRASESLHYELAASLRDKIKAIQTIQNEQLGSTEGSFDILIFLQVVEYLTIYVLMIRNGKMIGNNVFFRKIMLESSKKDVLSHFVLQYYSTLNHTIPKTLISQELASQSASLKESLSRYAGHSVSIRSCLKGSYRQWYGLAQVNAKQALEKYLSTKQQLYSQFVSLKKALELNHLPKTIECFDVSHHQGDLTVASCVVFGLEGPLKKEYRSFNITGITPGDDISALNQVLERRYNRLIKEGSRLPDLILIDGGIAQLKQAAEVLLALGALSSSLLSVAKDASRQPGKETIYLFRSQKIEKFSVSPQTLLLLLRIRDEAHRFALHKHRQKKIKKGLSSPLEQIPGVGTKRREKLLSHFGGLQGLMNAHIEDLKKIPGFHAKLAKRIYDGLRNNF